MAEESYKNDLNGGKIVAGGIETIQVVEESGRREALTLVLSACLVCVERKEQFAHVQRSWACCC